MNIADVSVSKERMVLFVSGHVVLDVVAVVAVVVVVAWQVNIPEIQSKLDSVGVVPDLQTHFCWLLIQLNPLLSLNIFREI